MKKVVTMQLYFLQPLNLNQKDHYLAILKIKKNNYYMIISSRLQNQVDKFHYKR